MIQMIDLAKIRLKSSDEAELSSVLKVIVGQPFHSFQISYGDELRIHLGEPRPARRPGRPKAMTGSYVIGTRASSWSLRSQARSQFLTNNDPGLDAHGADRLVDLQVIEREMFVAPNAAVEAVRIFDTSAGHGFGLSWTDGSEFILFPAKPDGEGGDEEDHPLADWEVFLPDQRLLAVGPGRQWSYTDSSSPQGAVGS